MGGECYSLHTEMQCMVSVIYYKVIHVSAHYTHYQCYFILLLLYHHLHLYLHICTLNWQHQINFITIGRFCSTYKWQCFLCFVLFLFYFYFYFYFYFCFYIVLTIHHVHLLLPIPHPPPLFPSSSFPFPLTASISEHKRIDILRHVPTLTGWHLSEACGDRKSVV